MNEEEVTNESHFVSKLNFRLFKKFSIMEEASSIRSSSGNEVKFRPHELASSFEVSNSSSKYLAFKVQTTNIDLFLVSPNVGIVSPGEKRSFKVTRNLSGMSANGEKFRIIFVPVDEAAFIKYRQMKPKTSKNFKQEFGNELWKSENRQSLHLICIVDTSVASPPTSPSEGENRLKIKSFLSLSWIKNVLVPNSPRNSNSNDQDSSQSLSKDESMKLKDVGFHSNFGYLTLCLQIIHLQLQILNYQ